MSEIAELVVKLGLGLSRVLRYSYGGFLLLFLGCFLNPALAKKVLDPMPWELAALTIFVLGTGLYAIHRGFVIPIHHLTFCAIMRTLDWWHGREAKDSDSPTRWFNSMGVPRGYRMWAYTVVRRALYSPQERDALNTAHAESGLVVMTLSAFVAVTFVAYFRPNLSDVTYPWLLVVTAFLLPASFATPIEQHSIECMYFRTKKNRVEAILRDAGFRIRGQQVSED